MAKKVQTYYTRFATPKNLTREVQTEVKDLAKSLKGMAANLTMCLEKDSAELLVKYCTNYEPDLVRMAATLKGIGKELS